MPARPILIGLPSTRHADRIVDGWAAAVSGWRSNPLALAWASLEEGRSSRVSAWRREPGLRFAATLLYSALGVILAVLLYEAFSRAGPGGQRYLREELAVTASLALSIAALIWFTLLMISRAFAVAQLGFGLLARSPARNARVVLDDMVCITALSEQQLLVGFAAYCCRLLWLPQLGTVLALSALLGFTQLEGYVAPQPLELVLVFPAAIFVAASTLLSCLTLSAWCVSLSLADRQGIYAPLAAVSTIVALGIIGVLGLVLWGEGSFSPQWRMTDLEAACWVLITLLLPVLGLYLARRLDFMRSTLALGLPILMLLYIAFADWLAETEFDRLIFELGWTMQSFALIGMQHSAILPALGIVPDPGYGEPMPQWRLWVLPLLQLVVLCVLAEFARDALRRRRWGSPVRER